MDKDYNIVDGSFYITHVCNLACNHCESFNNFAWTNGHFKWADYKADYKKWSEILYIDKINIHGGEPITNPDIINWAKGIKKLWPNSKEYYVSCNGISLKNRVDLAKKLIKLGWSIDIVMHDPSHRQEVEHLIKTILEKHRYKIEKTDKKKNRYEYVVTKTGQLLISLEETYYFKENAISKIENGVVHLRRSDPVKAHTLCFEDLDDQCVGFFKGRMYKCPLTGMAEDLVNRFTIEEYAKDLLLSYKYGWPYDTKEELDSFFENLHKPLKQCTLCADKKVLHPIFPMPTKKPKI